MARRRPWPHSSNEHRISAITAARAIRDIADDLGQEREWDRRTIEMALMHIKVYAADIERWLTLAKFGEVEEG